MAALCRFRFRAQRLLTFRAARAAEPDAKARMSRFQVCQVASPFQFPPCVRRGNLRQETADIIHGQKMPQKCQIHLENITRTAQVCSFNRKVMEVVTANKVPFTQVARLTGGFKRVSKTALRFGFAVPDRRDRAASERETDKFAPTAGPKKFLTGTPSDSLRNENSPLNLAVSTDTAGQRAKDYSNG